MALPPDGKYSAVELTPNGTEVVLAEYNGTVTLLDVATGRQLDQVLEPSNRAINRAYVSDNGSQVLLAYRSPDPAETSPIARQPGAFDGASALLASLSQDGPAPVELTLPGADDRPAETEAATGTESVTAAAFSPDGRRVTLGSSYGRVAEYDTESGELRWSSVVHDGNVSEIHVDEATGNLVTIGGPSADTSYQVVMLDGDGIEPPRTVPSAADVMAAMPTTDSQHMVLFTTDGQMRTVPLDDMELIDLVRDKVAYSLTADECKYYLLETDC
jgi:WD40 repeat protein